MLPTATSALRADEIAGAFGLGSPAVLEGPVARGEQGQVWRLTTPSGAFAVKQSFTPVDPAEAELDAAFQDAAFAAGLPLPRVLRTTEGRVLAELAGGTVRVHTWVDVLPVDRTLDPAEIGRLLAALHAVVVPTTEPIHPWYVDPVGAEAWAELIADITTAGAPFAGDLAAVVPRVLDVERILVRRPATQVCHMDLWADNVRRTPAGGLIVLDWENCGPGDPSQELANALFEFGGGDSDRMAALATAYREAGGPGRVTGLPDLTMLVAQLGHIGEMASRRWLAEPDPVERLHLEGWVREFLDQPVTREVAEGIVAAVR